jgi:hypothetical protein
MQRIARYVERYNVTARPLGGTAMADGIIGMLARLSQRIVGTLRSAEHACCRDLRNAALRR